MFQGKRVVSVTPFGRRRYVEILVHYLLTLRDVIDQHHFWINTNVREDLKYARTLTNAYPDFFKLVFDSSRYVRKSSVQRICRFWQRCNEDDTLYLKFDDDLVWIADGAIARLLQFRLDHPSYLVVFPNTINNSLCSHLHQRMGLLPAEPPIEYECMGEVSWRRWQTARVCHDAFFRLFESGERERYYFAPWELRNFERFSINAMCWLGRDLAEWTSHLGDDDEKWVTEDVPRDTRRVNCIVGDSLVAHFAYSTQRAGLEANTNAFDRYKALMLQQNIEAGGHGPPFDARPGISGRLRAMGQTMAHLLQPNRKVG